MFPGNQSYEEGPKQFVLVLLKKYEKKYPENCTFLDKSIYQYNTPESTKKQCIFTKKPIICNIPKSTHFETNLNVDK